MASADRREALYKKNKGTPYKHQADVDALCEHLETVLASEGPDSLLSVDTADGGVGVGIDAAKEAISVLKDPAVVRAVIWWATCGTLGPHSPFPQESPWPDATAAQFIPGINSHWRPNLVRLADRARRAQIAKGLRHPDGSLVDLKEKGKGKGKRIPMSVRFDLMRGSPSAEEIAAEEAERDQFHQEEAARERKAAKEDEAEAEAAAAAKSSGG